MVRGDGWAWLDIHDIPILGINFRESVSFWSFLIIHFQRPRESLQVFWTHHRHEETHPSAEWKRPWDLTLQWNIHQKLGWNTEPTLATPRRRRGGVFGAPEVLDGFLGCISVTWGYIPLSDTVYSFLFGKVLSTKLIPQHFSGLIKWCAWSLLQFPSSRLIHNVY